MALKCNECGAPLEPKGDERRIECTYCGCVHEQKRPEPSEHEPAASPPKTEESEARPITTGCAVVSVLIGGTVIVAIILLHDHFADRKPAIPAQHRMVLEVLRVESAKNRKRSSQGRVTITGTASDLRIRIQGRRPGARRPPRPVAERFTWKAHGTCVVDADGDDVTDVASMTLSSKSQSLTIVSGKDGRVLWRGGSVPRNTPHYCVSQSWVAVDRPGFRLRFHHVRRPNKPVTIKLRDKLNHYTMGRGCVKLETDDGSVVGFTLPAGTPTRCRAGKRRHRNKRDQGLTHRRDRRCSIRQDNTRYEVSIRKQGTPILTLQAQRQGRRLWSKELAHAATRAGVGLAFGGGTLVIYGATTARQSTGLLLGFDPATGTIRYTQRLKIGGDSPSFFHHNGRFVLIAYSGELFAFDPATGKLKWTVGH